MFGRLWDKLKLLWKLAKSERATPAEIAWAVALGVFSGCTPLVGFHGGVAVAIATLFKKNRLFAFIGSRISNFMILPFVTIAEIQLAHRLRAGAWVTLDREHAVQQAGSLLLDWWLGCIPVGAALALVLGSLAFAIARRRDRRRTSSADPQALPQAHAD